MTHTGPSCAVERRRDDVRRAERWNGIDYLEVDDDQLRLCVRFLDKAPEDLAIGNVVIEGGERIRDIKVVGVAIRRHDDPEIDDCLEVVVDRPGDFSTYTLKLVEAGEDGRPTDRPLRGFDVRYAHLHFSFKAGCPTDLDCTDEACPPEPREDPQLDYLAKDYESFRRLILDRLALIMPDWQERHAPDLQLTLVELLAYVGDQLSYYQDSVGTEAYLATARRRISIRRHARLVDYLMHEGCNARAWLALTTDTDVSFAFDDLAFFTSPPVGAAVSGLVPAERFEELVRAGALVYEAVALGPRASIDVRVAHNAIRVYTWGDAECCLDAGATSAVLVDQTPLQPAPEVLLADTTAEMVHGDVVRAPRERDVERDDGRGREGERDDEGRALDIVPGDVVVFEEVKGPITGDPADADPRRRHAVRVTRARRTEDPLHGVPLLEIAWDEEDALPFPVCISSRGEAPECALIEDVSVVRGNVILVDHGRTTGPEDIGTVEGEPPRYSCDECEVGESESRPKPFEAELVGAPLTFAEPIPIPRRRASAYDLADPASRDPRRALAQVFVDGLAPGAHAPDRWDVRSDLLASERDQRHVAVEVDDHGRGHLRFGDDFTGMQPAQGTVFVATYRIGNGITGNVGPDTITGIVPRAATIDGIALTARNPLAAAGGTAPETEEEVRRLAPHAYRTPIVRAIVPSDYATLAQAHAKVQRAGATMRWTGSWYEAQVAIDPLGVVVADAELLEEIRQLLYPPRRIGHDLRVLTARTVPLDIVLEVCVDEEYIRGHVEADLRALFSNRRLPDGTLGFFHPDNLTFGAGVYVSTIVAAAQRVTGVKSVTVKRLARLFDPEPDPTGHTTIDPSAEAIAAGVLALAPGEIARLDNDRTFPERGKITFEMEGGR